MNYQDQNSDDHRGEAREELKRLIENSPDGSLLPEMLGPILEDVDKSIADRRALLSTPRRHLSVGDLRQLLQELVVLLSNFIFVL